MTDFDFDTSDSDLNIGIEVEYPRVDPEHDDTYRGKHSKNLHRRCGPVPFDGHETYDGTVGAEFVSTVLNIEDAPAWYGEVLEFVEEEFGEEYNPVGVLQNGNTAGMHLHLSSLDRKDAKLLHDWSFEPWMQVLFCSSIAVDPGDETITCPVFRGGSYCTEEFDEDHYSNVNCRSSSRGHYEWRLPEPSKLEHMEIIARFLALFDYDPSAAREYAIERLESGDERITSISRAKKIGLGSGPEPVVSREMSPEDGEGLYEQVADTWALPEIFRVRVDGTEYYVTQSDMTGEVSIGPTTIEMNDVLYADSLNSVEDADQRSQIVEAFHLVRNARRETDATNHLKEIVN